MGKIRLLQKKVGFSQQKLFLISSQKFLCEDKKHVTDYEVYRNEKIYSKGFQNTPNFYLYAFMGVIGSYSNVRCFE